MTDYVESDGWVQFINGSNTIRLYCEHVRWRMVKKGRLKHYEGEVNVPIAVYKKYVVITIEGAWLNSNSKITNYLNYFETWLDSGAVNFKLQRNSNGDFEKLDGVNTVFPVMPTEDLGQVEKISYGDQEVYYIEKIMLEGAGTPS